MSMYKMEELRSLPSLEERKKLLGFVEGVSQPAQCNSNKRRSKSPLHLPTTKKPPPTKVRKAHTAAHRGKRKRMATKPPIAPKPAGLNSPPKPRPRKKGPPPEKPIPYRRHREFREKEVSTFKENHSIHVPRMTESPEPQLFKRRSEVGEPSAEFYQVKRETNSPVQCVVPVVPKRLKKEVVLNSIEPRSRLDTPVVPPDPEIVLRNGVSSPSSEENTSPSLTPTPKPRSTAGIKMPPSSLTTTNGAVHQEVYTEAYGHIELEEEIEYAVVTSEVNCLSPSTAERLRRSKSPSPSPMVETPPPIPPLPGSENEYNVTSHVIERCKHSSMSPPPVTNKQNIEDIEYLPLDRPDKPVLVTPDPDIMNEYSSLDRPAGFQHHGKGFINPTQDEEYSHLNGPADISDGRYEFVETGVAFVPEETFEEARPQEPPVVPRNKGKKSPPTKPKPIIPKRDIAKKASEKLQGGDVQLASSRDRSVLQNEGALATRSPPVSPMFTLIHKASRPPPAPKPYRPRHQLSNDSTTNEQLSTPNSMAEFEEAGYETINAFSPEPGKDESLNSQSVDSSKEEELEKEARCVSPKFEVDIDHIVCAQQALKMHDSSKNKEGERFRYENQAIVDIIHEKNQEYLDENVPDASAVIEAIDALPSPLELPTLESFNITSQPPAVPAPSSPSFAESVFASIEERVETFIVPQHAVPGAQNYCDVELNESSASPLHQPLQEKITHCLVLEKSDEDNVMEGVVHLNNYPNPLGYCEIAVSSPTAHAPPPQVLSIVPSHPQSSSVTQPNDTVEGMVLNTQGYYDVDVRKPPQHMYEAIPDTHEKPTPAPAAAAATVVDTGRGSPKLRPPVRPKSRQSHHTSESTLDGRSSTTSGDVVPEVSVNALHSTKTGNTQERAENRQPSFPVPKQQTPSDVVKPKRVTGPPRRKAPPPPVRLNPYDLATTTSSKKDTRQENAITSGLATLPRKSKSPKPLPKGAAPPPPPYTGNRLKGSNNVPAFVRKGSGDVPNTKSNKGSGDVPNTKSNKGKQLAPLPPTPTGLSPSATAHETGESSKQGDSGSKKFNVLGFLNKKSSSASASPELGRRGSSRRKRNKERKEQHVTLTPQQKTMSLPHSARRQPPPPVLHRSLELEEDEDFGLYSTIKDTMKKKPPLPVPVRAASPSLKVSDEKDASGYDLIDFDKRSPKSKKQAKGPPLHQSTSVEHLYESTDDFNNKDGSKSASNSPQLIKRSPQQVPELPRPNLKLLENPPEPNEIPENVDVKELYAQVTKPKKKGKVLETKRSASHGDFEGDVQNVSETKNMVEEEEIKKKDTDEPERDTATTAAATEVVNSLREQEGLVVTYYSTNDDGSGSGTVGDVVEIEHTTANGGDGDENALYAVVKPVKNKKKKTKPEPTQGDTASPPADASANNIKDKSRENDKIESGPSADGSPAPKVSQKPPRPIRKAPPKPKPYYRDQERATSPQRQVTSPPGHVTSPPRHVTSPSQEPTTVLEPVKTTSDKNTSTTTLQETFANLKIDTEQTTPRKLPTPPKSPISPTPQIAISLPPMARSRAASLASKPPSFPPPPPPPEQTPSPDHGNSPENDELESGDHMYATVSETLKKDGKKQKDKKRSSFRINRFNKSSTTGDSQHSSSNGITSPASEEEGYSLARHNSSSSPKKKQASTLPASAKGLVLVPDSDKPLTSPQRRAPHMYSTIQSEDGDHPVETVPMVSHGYATVTNKRGGEMRKKSSKYPQLKPRTKPPPPPPSGGRSRDPNLLSPAHDSYGGGESIDPHLGMRLHVSMDPQGGPQFLFSEKHRQSFIKVGERTEIMSSSSHSVSTSTIATNEEDSDADILYSTEWDESSEDEGEEEKKEGPPNPPRSKTYYIAHEILTTERTFVKGLTLIDKDFRQTIKSANNAHEKPVITEEQFKLLMGNVSSLLTLNSGMLQELEARMAHWDTDTSIGDILLIRAPYLKIYTEYISKFDKVLKLLEELTKKNPLFAEVLHEFEAQPKCASIPLAGYMLDIVQRITRYKLLLGDYIKHLPEDSVDRTPSEKAHEIISSVATHVNETIRQMDNFRKVCEVRKKLIGDTGDTLITPYRKLLKEGELLKFSRKEKQPRMFFLFTDILIYASLIPPANSTYKVIKRIPLEGMRVEPLDDPEMRYGFQIVSTCKSFRLEASNGEERHQWLTAFQVAIKEHSKRMEGKQKMHLKNVDGTDMTDSAVLGQLAPPWLPDSAVSMCQLCSVNFTVTRRRHHCRACGMIFCADCSGYLAPLKYMNNKVGRVCQTCFEKLIDDDDQDKSVRRPTRTHKGRKVSMPSVLQEVRARDQNAQISGYLLAHPSKTRRWKKRWYIVYNLVMYEFERHEDVAARRSITLPSYKVISPAPDQEDNLVFCLIHPGTGKEYFKVDTEEQLERWVDVLQKAVLGEIDDEEDSQTLNNSIDSPLHEHPESPNSPLSPDQQEEEDSS